jgi:tetratricopeptide (TPR) repeat protein
MCSALEQITGSAAASASAAYDRANCAEINGRPTEAIRLLQKYLELSPQALDTDAVHARIAELQSLLALPEQKGSEIRRLYGSAYGYLAERKYDRALAAFTKAKELASDFLLTYWRLGLIYEAMGDLAQARDNFSHYRALSADDAAKSETDLHLTTLDEKKSKYDDEVGDAEEILSDLFNRGMNLSFNLDNNRSAMRVRRARVKNKKQQKGSLVGGFAGVPILMRSSNWPVQLSTCKSLWRYSAGCGGKRTDGSGLPPSERRPGSCQEFRRGCEPVVARRFLCGNARTQIGSSRKSRVDP